MLVRESGAIGAWWAGVCRLASQFLERWCSNAPQGCIVRAAWARIHKCEFRTGLAPPIATRSRANTTTRGLRACRPPIFFVDGMPILGRAALGSRRKVEL